MSKDKMNLIWGIEQMEKELAKNHSPASNIMSICTEVLKQVEEKPEYDKDNGYSWNNVMKKADHLFEYLHKQKYSAQDMAHIGLRLTHLANFAWMIESKDYILEKAKKDAHNTIASV